MLGKDEVGSSNLPSSSRKEKTFCLKTKGFFFSAKFAYRQAKFALQAKFPAEAKLGIAQLDGEFNLASQSEI